MDEMRFSQEGNALAFEGCKHITDIRYLKIDGRAALWLLTRRGNTNQKPHSSAIEECHLWRCGEKEGQTEDISIESDTSVKVVHWDQELADFCVFKVHTRAGRQLMLLCCN